MAEIYSDLKGSLICDLLKIVIVGISCQIAALDLFAVRLVPVPGITALTPFVDQREHRARRRIINGVWNIEGLNIGR